jgi:hypothetical protein
MPFTPDPFSGLFRSGSENAVRQYVEAEQPKKDEDKPQGPTDLFGQPLPPTQGKLF